jgi:hypothetical protein
VTGSPLIAGWIAHFAFWVLLIIGGVTGELGRVRSIVFVALWALGYFGLPHLPRAALLVASYVAVLDILLVLLVFKGDIRIR